MIKINIELLLISIIIGVGLMYMYAPKPEIILKMPNDKNIFIEFINLYCVVRGSYRV